MQAFRVFLWIMDERYYKKVYEENIVCKRRPFILTKIFGNWKDNVQLGELRKSIYFIIAVGKHNKGKVEKYT